MATPSPISAARNSARKLISVNAVTPQISRNVLMIAASAIISGSSARNEPKTTARITSAPIAPISVSMKTPGPLPPPEAIDQSPMVDGAPAASRPEITIGAAFAGGFALALILKRLAR